MYGRLVAGLLASELVLISALGTSSEEEAIAAVVPYAEAKGWRPSEACAKEFEIDGVRYNGCVQASPEMTPWCSTTFIYVGERLECAQHDAQSGADEHAGHGHSGTEALLLLFAMLFVGCCTLSAVERWFTCVPYTCALFVEGLAAGGAFAVCSQRGTKFLGSAFHSSVDMWVHMDPHLFLFIFLPPLIFGEAMATNVPLLRTVHGQCMLLACPGVIIGTFLTGMIAKFVFPYNWNWPAALLLGSILSATDPVAVVSIFNSLGVAPKLSMLIGGESLFNDGTAIVLFELFLEIAKKPMPSITEVAHLFFRMLVFGPVIGVAAGLAASHVIGSTSIGVFHGDTMVQMLVPVCTAFLTFLISEVYFQSSGILGSAIAGIVVAKFVWMRFLSREKIHTMWHTIEFIGNTLVFLLAGMMVGKVCVERRTVITAEDTMMLAVLYLSSLLVRAVMVGSLWPLLKRSGPALSFNDGLVTVWAGLRGAVGLILAIVVDLDPAFQAVMNSRGCTECGTKFTFFVGGMAGLTLLINGMFMPLVLRMLGMTNTDEDQKKLLLKVEQSLHETTRQRLEEKLASPAEDFLFSTASERLLERLVPGLAPGLTRFESFVKVAPSSFGGPGHEDVKGKRPTNVQGDLSRQTSVEDTPYTSIFLKSMRETVLRVVRSIYVEMADDGTLPRSSWTTRSLLESVDKAMLESESCLCDWRSLHTTMQIGKYRNEAEYRRQVPLLITASRWMRGSSRADYNGYQQRIACGLVAFMYAHRRAMKEVAHYFPMDAVVQQESEEQLQACRAELTRLREGVLPQVRTLMLAGNLLEFQRRHVARLEEEGILQRRDAEDLTHEVSHALQRLKSSRHLPHQTVELIEGGLLARGPVS